MIDYEAAAEELHEQSADQSDTFDAAKAIVDAALGGEPLYRSEPDVMMYTKGKFIQVWPEVALPSADDVYGILSDD